MKIFIIIISIFFSINCFFEKRIDVIPAINAVEYVDPVPEKEAENPSAKMVDAKIPVPIAPDPKWPDQSKKTKPKPSPLQIFEEAIYSQETFYYRVGDCQSHPPTSDPVPLKVSSADFNFTSKYKGKYLSFGLMENNGWPILLGYKHPQKIEQKHRTVLAFRGDRSGFHRTAFTQPLVEFSKNQRQEASILLMEELLYATEERDLLSSPLMVLCHYRDYPNYGRIGAQWPAMEGGENWKILDRLFPDIQNEIELVSYSNGNLLRSEFIKRDVKRGKKFLYFNPQKETPTEFIKAYREHTQLSNKKSKNVRGLIDFEGHYFNGKPVWDLAAFLLDEVEPSSGKYYYAINRIEEDKVFQNTVFLIQALDLEGIEEDSGIIRYFNKKGNIIFDVVTSVKAPHYSYYGIDLREKTKFQKAVNPNRTQVNHGTIVETGFSRFTF